MNYLFTLKLHLWLNVLNTFFYFLINPIPNQTPIYIENSFHLQISTKAFTFTNPNKTLNFY